MTTLLAADTHRPHLHRRGGHVLLLGTLALIGAVGVVMAANAVYSAMFLAMTMIILAVFYMIQDALFLGVVQIVVYTGAVMMLFLFVLMLIGVDSAESLVETLRGQRVAAVLAGVGFGIVLIAGIGSVDHGRFHRLRGQCRRQRPGFGGADLLPLPVGIRADQRTADHRSHRRDDSGAPGALRAPQDAARAVDRAVPPGGHPTPLPSPGVYARHNAVDMAARLPDGSYSRLSVPQVLEQRTVDDLECTPAVPMVRPQ